MRLIFLALSTTIALAACGGPSMSPQQKAQKKANIARNEAAVDAAQTVQVGGKAFRVAVMPDRTFALVENTSKAASYVPAEVEAAARSATGCKAAFDPGILAFLSGDMASANLAELRKKVSGKFYGWRVNLSC